MPRGGCKMSISYAIVPSERLRYERFQAGDLDALAALLADPLVTRNITANGATPERCRASAQKRIEWYNRYWKTHGYGVWALRPRQAEPEPANDLVGWCGFVPPDTDEEEPEILYVLARRFHGLGLGTEAARHAVGWLFTETEFKGASAVISSRFNPGSVNVAHKLGFVFRDKMDFWVFLPDPAQACDVLDFDIWRIAEGPEEDLEALVRQAGFRAGQLVAASGSAAGRVEDELKAALAKRCSGLSVDMAPYQSVLIEYFHKGMNDAFMDRYYLSRANWLAAMGMSPIE